MIWHFVRIVDCGCSEGRSFTTRKVARFPERSFMSKRLGFVFVALMAVPVALLGQEKPPASSAPPAQSAPPANPISASEKGFYSFVSSAVVGAAQKIPAENYSFKPTPEVRTFGQLVGHVADASYMFCSHAIGASHSSNDI